MITIYAKCDCGCCTAKMRFENSGSAADAFAMAGLGNGITIVDDENIKHEGIDTFYGFSESNEEQSDRSLGYLADLIK